MPRKLEALEEPLVRLGLQAGDEYLVVLDGLELDRVGPCLGRDRDRGHGPSQAAVVVGADLRDDVAGTARAHGPSADQDRLHEPPLRSSRATRRAPLPSRRRLPARDMAERRPGLRSSR